jgi:glycine/serine hydroxymethyltransferase
LTHASRRVLAIANAMEGMILTDAAHVVGIVHPSLGDAVQ